MKTRLLTALALFAAWTSLATDLYWDANGVAANSGTTAAGIWGTDAFWNDSSTGTGGTITAITTNADNVFFSSGTNYTGTFTVTINGSQTANSVAFQEGQVTLNGGSSLTLSGGIVKSTGLATTLNTQLLVDASQSIANNAAGLLTLGGLRPVDGSGNTYTVSFTGSGSGGTTLGGTLADASAGTNQAAIAVNTTNGITTLTGTNTYTGGTTLASGTLLGRNPDATNVLQAFGSGTMALDGGTLQLRANGTGSNQTIAMGNNVIVKGDAALNVNNYSANTGSTFALGTLDLGNVTLTVSNGSSYGASFGTTTLAGDATINTSAPVSLGAVGETGGARSLTKRGSGILTLTGINTYSGGTTVAAGTLTPGAAYTLGSNVAGNDVTVTGNGILTLNAASVIGSNQQVAFVQATAPTTAYLNGALPMIVVNHTDALPTFAGSSETGVIALSQNYATALDQSSLGNSYLGATSGVSYTASSLAPGADGVYRLGGGGNTLTLTGAGNLIAGAGNDLVVGAAGFNGTAPTNGTGTVVLQGANSFTGTTTINPGSTLVVQRGTGTIAGSTAIDILAGTLSLQNFPAFGQASDNNNDRIGNSTPVTVERGIFQISGNGTAPGTAETIGDLTFKTTATTTLWNQYGTVVLTADELIRDGNATGLLRGDNLGVNGATGSTAFAKLVLTDAASVEGSGTATANTTTGQTTTTNLKVVPWLLADNSRSGSGSAFATYDTGVGLRPIRASETVAFSALTPGSTDDYNVLDTSATNQTFAASIAANSINLAPTAAISYTGAAGLTMASASGGLALTVNRTITLQSFDAINLGADDDSEAIILASTGTLNVNSPVNPGTGRSLTKGGSGTVTLNAANTFEGAMVLNAGTLNLRAANTQSGTTINGGTLSLIYTSTNALGGSEADVNINSSGILSINNASATGALALGGGNFYLNDGGAIYLYGGGGTRTVFLNKVYVTGNGYIWQDSGGGSGNKTLIDEIDMAAGAMLTTLRNNSSTNGFGTDTITIHGDATFNVLANNPDNAHATNFAKITGTGDVTKLGNGELWLAYSGYNNTYSTGAASDYTGDTRIEAGKLRIGTTNALPTSTTLYVNSEATFDLSTGGHENADANYDQTIAGLNDGSNGGGTVTANGTDANLGTTRTLALSGSGTYSFSGRLVDTSVAFTGSLALTINGGGTQVLSGISTFTGVTTVSNGSTLELGDGATRNGAVGGPIVVDGTSFLTFNNPLAQTLSSAISGTGTFVKNGAGALTLNGANTFGGTLAVNVGELNLLGATTTAVTVASGAIFSPGGSAGEVTVGALTFNGASVYKWEVSATGTDRIQVNGDLTVNGTPTLRLTNLDNTPPPASWAIIDYTGSLLNDAAWTIDYSETSAGTVSNWTDGTGAWDDNANWDQQGWGGGSISYDTVNKQVMLTGVTASTCTPSSTTDVVIAPPGNAAVTGSAAPRTINSLVLGDSSANSHSLTLQAGAPLTTTTTVTVNPSGTLTATAAALSASHLTVAGTASLGGVIAIPTISSSGTTGFVAGATGTITALDVTGGTTTVETGAAPILTTVTLSAGANLTTAGGSIGALTITAGYSGTVNINPGTTLGGDITVPSGAFNYNSGGTLASLAVDGGSASLGGGSTATTATVATGAVLALHDGTIGTIAASTGTLNTYAGATVGTATLTGGVTGAAVNTNGTYLTVTDTLTLNPGTGDFTATYTGPAGGFGIRGDDLANAATGILLNTAGGKVTLTQQIGGYTAGLEVRAWTTNGSGLDTLEGTPYSLNSPSVTPNHSTPGLGGLDDSLSYMTNAIHWNLNDSQEWASNGGLSAPPYPTDYRTTYAIEYRGLVYIPSDGTYRFATSSDDRSALWLDPTSDNPSYNDAIVQNRFDQAVTRRQSGQLSLNEGYHEIIVRFTQGNGGHGLYVEWDPTGGSSFADIPGLLFFHGGAVASPIDMPTTAVTALATNELALPTGDNHFGTLTLGGAGTNLTLSGTTSVTFHGNLAATGTPSVDLNGPALILAGAVDAIGASDVLTLPSTTLSAPTVTLNGSGLGTIILTGTTSFSPGASLILGGGQVLVNGTLGEVATTVGSGAWLGGAGSITGPVTVAAGGGIAPGNSPGTLTVDNTVILLDGTLLAFDLDAPDVEAGTGGNDWLLVTDQLTLNPNLTLTIEPGPRFGEGTYHLIGFGSLIDNSDTFRNWLVAGLPDYTFAFRLDGNSLDLLVTAAPIPEPASLLLLATAAALAARRRR